jgi:putative hydrolase of the HAD superfamily
VVTSPAGAVVTGTAGAGRPAGVVVDLDDTLYLQATFLTGTWAHVGRVAAALDPQVDAAALAAACAAAVAARGSDGGGVLDAAVAAVGADPGLLPALVAAFRAARPAALPLLPGVRPALDRLRAAGPLGVLTDGDPGIQRAKLAALGLEPGAAPFDAVVITDELGGRHLRKPRPDGLLLLAARLGVAPADVVVIGDRPGKDLAVAHAVGARAVRVRTGEHAGAPAVAGCTCAEVATFAAAADLVLAGVVAPCPLAVPAHVGAAA